jgi:hypothetical protein
MWVRLRETTHRPARGGVRPFAAGHGLPRDVVLEGKYASVAPELNDRERRLWAAAESRAIGYGGDAWVSAATGPARQTIRNGRR